MPTREPLQGGRITPAPPGPRLAITTDGRRSHPEDAELRRRGGAFQRSGEREPKHLSCLGRLDDAIVPQAGGAVVARALRLVLLEDGRLECGLLLRPELAPLALDGVCMDRGQYPGGLLPAHHGDPRVGPHEQEARRERAAAHPVVPGAVTAADDARDFGHGRA